MRPHSVLLVTLTVAACSFPRPPDVDFDAGPIDAASCTANTTSCADGNLTVCDPAGHPTVTACAFGCFSDGTRCADLAPSNALGSYLDQASTAVPLVLTGNATIDTSARTVRDGDGTLLVLQTGTVTGGPVEIFVIAVGSLEAGNIDVTGSRALAIVSNGDVHLNGTLSLSAHHATAGPGALVSGDGICEGGFGPGITDNSGGGGGGAFGTPGGHGGSGGIESGGAGGMPSGDATLVPLRGGCRGGHAVTINTDPTLRMPGAGGGAVQISARGRIRLEPGAFIAANGGGAKGKDGTVGACNDFAGTVPECFVGAGGGAGGGILLEAAALTVPGTAGLVANGGAGHCNYLSLAPDGQNSETPAPGSDCTAVPNGHGGDGAAGSSVATAGSNNLKTGSGGGGGTGRIRINLPVNATFDPGPPFVSPPPSLAQVTTR